jgi:hypothetical protein
MEYPWRAIPLAALTQQARLVAGPLLDPPAGGPSPRALGKPDKSFGIERMVLPDRIELSTSPLPMERSGLGNAWA